MVAVAVVVVVWLVVRGAWCRWYGAMQRCNAAASGQSSCPPAVAVAVSRSRRRRRRRRSHRHRHSHSSKQAPTDGCQRSSAKVKPRGATKGCKGSQRALKGSQRGTEPGPGRLPTVLSLPRPVSSRLPRLDAILRSAVCGLRCGARCGASLRLRPCMPCARSITANPSITWPWRPSLRAAN